MSQDTAQAPAKLLVSACLLGNPVRYDGRSRPVGGDLLSGLRESGRLVAFCPEMAGGLPVPRAAAEIIGGDGDAVLSGSAQVKTRDGIDVSQPFIEGARLALQVCRDQDIRVAVLTENSPSCGSGRIYDGSFRRQGLDGSGVTTALLRQQGIAVFNQFQLDEALALLDQG